MDIVSVLLPLRGRCQYTKALLHKLAVTLNSERINLLLFIDQDDAVLEIADQFSKDYKSCFNSLKIYNNPTKQRFYSVKSFNYLFERLNTKYFCWITNAVSVDPAWLNCIFEKFKTTFPDDIGVLSFGGKINKANIGMTSLDFIKHNEGEWFSPDYVINYCDDQLACRAILLGRYSLFKTELISFRKEIAEKILYDSHEEKIRLKKIDRGIFYKNSESNFGLPQKKTYPWKKFTETILPLRGIDDV